MALRGWNNIKPVFPFLRPYWRQYVWGTCSLIGEAAFWVAVPQIIGHAIDDLKREVTVQKLALYAGMLVAAVLCKAFFLFWTRMILIGISRDVEYDLRNSLYTHLQKLSLSYFQRTRVGDIMSRAINDLNAVRMMLGPGIMYSARTVVIMVAAIAMMYRISHVLTLASFALMPVIVLIVSTYGRKIHERFETIQERMADLSARAQESIAGMRVLRAYAQEAPDVARFRELNDEYVERNRKLIRVWSTFYPVLEMLMGLLIVIVLWVGGRQVARGGMTIGAFVAFNVYMGQLSWPMIAVGWVVNLYQRGTASLGRLQEILAEQPEIMDDHQSRPSAIAHGRERQSNGDSHGAGDWKTQPATQAALRVNGAPPASGNGAHHIATGASIEFRNLHFSYGKRPVLQDVNLSIPAGSTLAIVGPTGSGKSTLASLIPRLYEAPPETVFVDGRDIHQIPLADLRHMIGFVPQETFLFSETIRENIAFGVEQASDAQVREATEIAGLLPDIESFSRGFETLVGERGITLSGGQKQRAAIARAVLRSPRILILDDALSSVDTYTEERILTRLQSVLKGRTSILISHRISTVRNADQIVVLEQGRIAERGTHAELMANGRYYPELYQKQLLEEELERA